MKVLNDLLWNGKLKIYQDDESFMYSLDSVLLSKFVTLNKNITNILDIGTGNAPIPLILTSLTNANITGVEIQKKSYELAKESVSINNLNSKINLINGDINDIVNDLPNNYYDVVVTNPPFFKSNMLISDNIEKGIARTELTLTLEDIFSICKKVLKDKGRVAIVNRPERLVDIIVSMKKYGIEPKKIRFVYPKKSKPANHVLIEGMKNGNSELKIMDPFIVHNEDNSYTDQMYELMN